MKNNKALIILLLSAALWILMLLSAVPKLITKAAGDMPTAEEIEEEEYGTPWKKVGGHYFSGK